MPLILKKVLAKDRNNHHINKTYWQPCSPGDTEAVPMTWMDINGEDLLEPPVSKRHFIQSIKTTRPSVNRSDLDNYIKWTKDFGQEGF